MTSGIYCICNTVTGDRYIGRAVNIEQRWKQHRQQLISNKHCNHLLSNAWQQYGVQSLEFTIIEVCDEDMLLARECYWIDRISPTINLNFPQFGMWEVHAEVVEIERRKKAAFQVFQPLPEVIKTRFFEGTFLLPGTQLQWRLIAVMADREIDNQKLHELTGLHLGTIAKLRNNPPSRIDTDTLNKLCGALQCQPGDLLRYVPDIGADVKK